MPIEVSNESLDGWLVQMTDIGCGLARLDAHHNHLRIYQSKCIDHHLENKSLTMEREERRWRKGLEGTDLPFYTLNGINYNSDGSFIQLLEALLESKEMKKRMGKRNWMEKPAVYWHQQQRANNQSQDENDTNLTKRSKQTILKKRGKRPLTRKEEEQTIQHEREKEETNLRPSPTWSTSHDNEQGKDKERDHKPVGLPKKIHHFSLEDRINSFDRHACSRLWHRKNINDCYCIIIQHLTQHDTHHFEWNASSTLKGSTNKVQKQTRGCENKETGKRVWAFWVVRAMIYESFLMYQLL